MYFCPLVPPIFEASPGHKGQSAPKCNQIIIEEPLGNPHTNRQDNRMTQRGVTAILLHTVSVDPVQLTFDNKKKKTKGIQAQRPVNSKERSY